MSTKNGDKSRHHRVRRKLIARRAAMRALRAAVAAERTPATDAPDAAGA